MSADAPKPTSTPASSSSSGSKVALGSSKRFALSVPRKTKSRRGAPRPGQELGNGRRQIGHGKQPSASRVLKMASGGRSALLAGASGAAKKAPTKPETSHKPSSLGAFGSPASALAPARQATPTTGTKKETSSSGRSGAEPIKRGTAGSQARSVAKSSASSEKFSDSKKIAGEAIKGAIKGAAAGGVGAIPGAVAGVGKGILKSKKGRKAILAVVALSVMFSMLPIFALISMIAGDTSSNAVVNNEWEKADVAMASNGYDSNTLIALREATHKTGVPYPLIAAGAWANGETLELDQVTLRTPIVAKVETGLGLTGEIERTPKHVMVAMHRPVGGKDAEPETVDVDLDRPIGPYGFIYEDAVKKFGKESWTVADLVHPASAAELFAMWTADIARRADLEHLDLGTGVHSSTAQIDSVSGRPSYGFLDSDPDGIRAAGTQRAIWEKVLSHMPVEHAKEKSSTTYSAALQWYLGQNSSCMAGADSVGVVGEWTPPLVNSSMPSDEQDFGPRTIGQGYHDGLDMNTKDGSLATIYAASSGTVSLAEASAGYGPNWVKITHPDGTETHYGHMSARTVEVGDKVESGQEIGTEGDEGDWSQGAHLHFSVLTGGEFVDPVKFYAERGIDIFAAPGAEPPPSVVSESPAAPETGAGADEGQVRVVHTSGTEKQGKSAFAKSMKKTFNSAPDVVSLNGMYSRTKEQYTPAGYDSWRAAKATEHRESQSSALAWRTDKWTKVASGRATLVKNGPRADDNRYANWVTLKSSGSLGQVSVVSAQHILNPNQHGPKNAKRKELYRRGMVSLNGLVKQLELNGPVFIAGDFNHRSDENDSWGAEKMSRLNGYPSSYEVIGTDLATTNGGKTVDYIFGPKEKATPVKQWTTDIGASRKMLGVDWEVSADAVQSIRQLPDTWTGKGTQDGVETSITLDKTQLQFASQIANVATEVGAGADGAVIAFMTAMVEGKFKNYASDKYAETIGKEYPAGSVGSDHDSVGLFQQRPVSGWGTALDLLDPTYAAKAFFGGPTGPNGGSPRGLLDISGWETLPKGVAAQTVQVSAHPDRYAGWELAATGLYSVVQGAVTTTGANTCGGAVDAHYGNVPSEYNLGPVLPQTTALANLLGPMFGITTIGGYRASATDPGGHPSGLALDFMVPLTPEGKAQGDALAEYAKSNATNLNIDYIIWYQRIWSSARSDEGWRPMDDRGSDTANHKDHPHINVKP